MNLSITDFAKKSKIPIRVLFYLQAKGLIHDPLNSEDQIGLDLLEKIWGKREVLRAQVTHLAMPDRQSFLMTADLASKWERYAYSRFANHTGSKSLPIRVVISEIESTFGFELDEAGIKKVYKLRNRAQVHRHRKKFLPEKTAKKLLQSPNKE